MSDINFYEILKYIIPQLGFLVLVILFLNHWVERYKFELETNRRESIHQFIIPNKIRAYERMVLFLERISPHQLIPRLNQAELNANEFQFILIQDISTEYEHNLSQQLYITGTTWQSISLVKDQIIQEIIHAAQSLPENSTSKDLAYKILQEVSKSKHETPTQKVIHQLRNDLEKLLR